MQKFEVLDKLFRVQATIEHIICAKRVDGMELRYLTEAQTKMTEAIKAIASLKVVQ